MVPQNTNMAAIFSAALAVIVWGCYHTVSIEGHSGKSTISQPDAASNSGTLTG
jgi:hypothetical protein